MLLLLKGIISRINDFWVTDICESGVLIIILGPGTAVPNKHCAYMFGGVYQQVMNHFDQLSWPSNIFDILNSLRTEEDKANQDKPLEQLVS